MRLSKDDKETRFRQPAEAFVSTLMNAVEIDIPGSNGMKVLRNIPNLEGGGVPSDIIIRSVTNDFWNACIEEVDNPSTPRLVAVGNPGIGKSHIIPILIRKLLKARKTVVYIVRSVQRGRFYYEFIPGVGDSVITNIYPESWPETNIASFWLDTTYYIVDPSKYTGTCDPCNNVKAKVIIVASPHEKYWGGSQFAKQRWGVYGVFKYYPVWSLEELLLAREILGNEMSEADVYEGYRLFGGIPGNVFYGRGANIWLSYQANCINLLTLHEARWITRGDGYATNTFTSGSLKSFILGFVSSKEISFSVPQTVLLSSYIADRIGLKHMTDLWNYKFEWQAPGVEIFKGYCRSLLYDRIGKRYFHYRRNGSLFDKKFFQNTELGCCSKVCLAVDPVDETRKSEIPFVLFHAPKEYHDATTNTITTNNNKLFDFLFKDTYGHYYAYRVTLGRKDDIIDMNDLHNLETIVGGPNKLTLHYMVPNETYTGFNIQGCGCGNIWEMSENSTCSSKSIEIIMIKQPK